MPLTVRSRPRETARRHPSRQLRSQAARHLRWVVPALVLAVAALVRLWALSRPDQLVFDELYYVRDAVSQLAHGFPTVWPDDDPAFGGERARAFGDTASSIAHPPLGKWLIALGVLLFGADGAGIDTGWGWRIAVAVAGVAAVAVTMRLGQLMSGSVWVGALAGLLLALDGVHIVLSRVSLLDGFLTLFIVLGALFVWHDQAVPRRARPESGLRSAGSGIAWRRPWLLAAGAAFGCAAAVKWSGLYALAAFLILITVRDLLARLRAAEPRAWPHAAIQAVVTGAIALPAALLVYLATWTGWILNPGGQYRVAGDPWWVSLWNWHASAVTWHSSLTAPHPYQAPPITWPLALRPTAMYRVTTEAGAECPWAGGCVAAIVPLPNPLITGGGVAALLLLAWVAVRALWRASRIRSLAPLGGPAVWVAAIVLTGYLSGWVPWLLTFGRSAVFQFYAVVLTPFAALALALVLAALCRVDGGPLLRAAGLRLSASTGAVQGRRIAVAIVVAAAAALAILFFPLWSGMPVAEWFYRAHLWLPGWR